MAEQKPADDRACRRQEFAELRQILSEEPDNIEIVLRLVEGLTECGAIDEAWEELNKAVEECLKNERFSEAMTLMQRQLQVRPTRVSLHLEIGKTHLRMEQPEQAVQRFCAAFDQYLKAERYDRAEDVLRLIERVDPEGVDLLIKVGQLLSARGDTVRAIAVLRAAAERLEEEGQRQDFLVVGQQMLAIDPGLEDIRIKVGETLIAEARAFVNYGLFGKAIRALCQAIK